MVFDYYEHDLLGLLLNKIQLNPSQVKQLLRQLATGLSFMHSQGVVHRDLKSGVTRRECAG